MVISLTENSTTGMKGITDVEVGYQIDWIEENGFIEMG